jgi:hypothetical protein
MPMKQKQLDIRLQIVWIGRRCAQRNIVGTAEIQLSERLIED